MSAPIRVHRIDRAINLRFDLHGSSVDDLLDARGYLVVEGVATRTGVFIYDAPGGGEFREWRPPEHVFAPASIQSLRFVPLTNDHPDALLDATNTSDHQVGTVMDARRDGQLMAVRLVFTDKAAIQDIRDGKRELSCGYTAIVLERVGTTPQGERHDAIQTEIIYNHLALVDAARAGPIACLRIDGARIQRRISDMQQRKYKLTLAGGQPPIEIMDQTEQTETVIIAGVEHPVSPAIAMVINAQAEKIVSLTQEVMTLQGEQQLAATQGVPPTEAAAQANEIESANGQLERLAAKAAGADTSDKPQPLLENKDSQPMKKEDIEAIAAAAAKIVAGQVTDQAKKDRQDAQAHADTVVRARPYLDAGYTFGAKTMAEIHADAIKAADPKLEKKVDAMLERKIDLTSLFDVLCDGQRSKPAQHTDALGQGLWEHLKNDRGKSKMTLIDKARLSYLRRLGISRRDRALDLEEKLDAEMAPRTRQVTINLDGLPAGANIPTTGVVVDVAGKAPQRS